MSQFTQQLKDFVNRLREDGYPTVLVERAAERMEQLEDEVVRLQKLTEE
jgi:hypothetical protein